MRISDWSSDVCSSDLAENRYATGLSLGSGVEMTGTARVNSQGALATTDNPLDLAIEGDGFFQVTLPDGTIGYTRDGSFNLSAAGQNVTSDRMPLQPAIQVPEAATSITIAAHCTITAPLPCPTDPPNLAQHNTTQH